MLVKLQTGPEPTKATGYTTCLRPGASDCKVSYVALCHVPERELEMSREASCSSESEVQHYGMALAVG